MGQIPAARSEPTSAILRRAAERLDLQEQGIGQRVPSRVDLGCLGPRNPRYGGITAEAAGPSSS